MPEPTDNVAHSLRSAIEAGDFERACALTGPYRETIVRALRNAPSADARETIARETIAFLNERLHMARVLRAHLASRLAAATRAQFYQTPAKCDNTWLLQG